jgi:hypothetical protein
MHRFPILTVLFAGGAVVDPVTMKADDHREERYHGRGGREYRTRNNHEIALAAYTWGSNTGTIANSRESAQPGKETTSGGVTSTRTT